jgi:6-phosphogluconolactonase
MAAAHHCPKVVVVATAEQAAASGAAEIAQRAHAALADRGSFTLALSGGRTPSLMLTDLAALDMPWAHTTIYQVDERIGPPTDPQRNLTGLRAALPPEAQECVVPMPVEASDLRAACADYARRLPAEFDLIHLGLGADGHTASLVPHDPVLAVTEVDVALSGVYQDRRRMTLTRPRLHRTGAILWLVTGADKSQALAQLLAGDTSIPAGTIQTADQVVICDSAAHAAPVDTGR